MTYDTRKIFHGSQEITYGGIGKDASNVSYSTGVLGFAPTTEQDSKVIYADATTHMTLLNAKKLTIEQKNYQYTENEYAQCGYTLVNGGEVDNGTHPSFDVQRILEVQDENGVVTKKLEVYYNVTSSDYTESEDEDEEEINPKEYTRTLTVVGRQFEGIDGTVKKFFIERTKENATVFDTYNTSILTPGAFANLP